MSERTVHRREERYDPAVTALLGGKYVLERRLGMGGMAEVFAARTIGTAGFSRPIAIKRILPGYSQDPTFAARFVAEATITARLRHPNIVPVLDFDQDDERRLFLVMDLVDGPDLNGLSKTGLLPIPTVLYVIAEMLRGLQHAHDLPDGDEQVRGVIHRDVSPHNVLLSWEGEVRISDFGISKVRNATRAPGSMMIVGKPAYMSPEQANGQPLDGTSDLFAVGIMLWELLCGRPLFESDTMESTFARVLFAPVESPVVYRPDLDPEIARITLRLLERDGSKRYPTAKSALDDLLSCRNFPRGGREILAQLLLERFPDRVRAKGSSPGQPPAAPDRATVPTVLERPAAPSLPAPVGVPDIPPPLSFQPPAIPRLSSKKRRWALASLILLLAATGAIVGVLQRDGGVTAHTPSEAAQEPTSAQPPQTAAERTTENTPSAPTTDATDASSTEPGPANTGSAPPPASAPDAEHHMSPRPRAGRNPASKIKEIRLDVN